METVDREVVEALALQIMLPIRAHFREQPRAVETNLEVLNALAIAAGVILAAARSEGCESKARAFFETSLKRQIDEIDDCGVRPS